MKKLEAFSKLCFWVGTAGCSLAALIPLSAIALLFIYLLVFRSNDHRPTAETQPPASVSASQAPDDDPPSTIASVSSFRIGEKRTLRKGSWTFADEQAYNEFLSATKESVNLSDLLQQANRGVTEGGLRLRDLQASGRVSYATKEPTVFVVATNGFAGFVQARSRGKGQARILFWTSPQNVEPLAAAKDFLMEQANLPEGAFFYRSLEQIRAFKKADEDDNTNEVMRLGKQLEVDRLSQKTRVKVLGKADDPYLYEVAMYLYKVEMKLPNGSRVRGWARARDLEPVLEDAVSASQAPSKGPPATQPPIASERRYVHIDSQSADVVIEKNVSTTPEIINETNENEVTFQKSIMGPSVEVTSKVRQTTVTNAGRIIVRVPSNYDVDAEGMSAAFTVIGFEGSTLNISTMSGNIKSSAVGSAHTKFKSMSGNIRVISPIVSGTHEFNAMSGDIVIMLGPGSSAKIFAQSEKSSASINDKNARSVSIEDIVSSGHATVRATTISGNIDCRY
jgi:hypothetical protein